MSGAKEKLCYVCRRLKPISDFYRRSNHQDRGHHSYCRPCFNAATRVLRANKALRKAGEAP